MSNFKDIYNEAEGKQEAEVTITGFDTMQTETIILDEDVPTTTDTIIADPDSIKKIEEGSYLDSYSEEAAKQEIREQIEEEFTAEVRQNLKEQLIVEIRKEVRDELLESIRKELQDDLATQLLESNKMIAGALGRLAEKVESLQENLNITIPTPEIKLLVPNSNKRVVRNKDGDITGIVTDDT